MKLTDQQQTVVAHEQTPALVFAVAGAGKTTAMVHRIARLVADGMMPQRILATSFGRGNVQDLRQALSQWPACRAVEVRTLHSLGRDIIKCGQKYGLWRKLKLNGRYDDPEQMLLNYAIAEARRRAVPYKKELEGLDRQDFLAYVGYSKGNLQFANIDQVRLPVAGQKLASQAPRPDEPLDWYLDLYRLFEEARLREGAVTFSDMLLTGWQTLITSEEVQADIAGRYDAVLVDEFQDINLAQSEILDLITTPHRNYMAIGDDDQTIYEWRGANPRFILDFAKRYQAKTYLMSDNFRCPAGPIALANHVIQHNKRRKQKKLSLTRGFEGETAVFPTPNLDTMAQQMVQQIARQHKAGTPYHEMAVLVRLNAQTPFIEQQLILQNIPYQVSSPFYERSEIKTLIQYGRLAYVEKQLQAGKGVSERARTKFLDAWQGVCNRPKRYINHKTREMLAQQVLAHQRPFTHLLRETAQMMNTDWQAEPLDRLADTLGWLAQNLDKPADMVLSELEYLLDYKAFLWKTSGFPQTAVGRVASVSAFITYAKGKGSFLQFMGHIAELNQRKIGREQSKDAVVLSTIHKAKGLEWPVVFVPQCNQEVLPLEMERADDLEEERRIFYVALTRTKRDLYLYYVTNEPRSQFLTESRHHLALADMAQLKTLLEQDALTGQEEATAVRLLKKYHWQRYLSTWLETPLAVSAD